MKPRKSIIGGGVARDLLKGINNREFIPTRRELNMGLRFSLRKCWQWTGTGFDPKTISYGRKKYATGGMILTADMYDPKMDSLCIRYSREYRIKPENVKKAEHYLCMAITRIYREAMALKTRVREASELEEMVKRIETMPKFTEWVDRKEKTIGTSTYADMSEDVIRKWKQAINTEWFGKESGYAGSAEEE